MVVVAAGYSSDPNPLMQMLAEQELVKLDRRGRPETPDGLVSAASPQVLFNTAGVVHQPADTTFRGRSIGAVEIARRITGEERENHPGEEVARYLLHHGSHPVVVLGLNDSIEGARDARGRHFNRENLKADILYGPASVQADLPAHHTLEADSPEWLTPAERFTLSRARQVAERLGPAEQRLERALQEAEPFRPKP